MSDMLGIFVPRDEADIDTGPLAGIRRGSAIIGRPTDGGVLDVSFEGNIFDAVNLRRYAERVASAYDRLRSNYPTVARRSVPSYLLTWVGAWDHEHGRVLLGWQSGALIRWLDVSLLDPEQLLTHSIR